MNLTVPIFKSAQPKASHAADQKKWHGPLPCYMIPPPSMPTKNMLGSWRTSQKESRQILLIPPTIGDHTLEPPPGERMSAPREPNVQPRELDRRQREPLAWTSKRNPKNKLPTPGTPFDNGYTCTTRKGAPGQDPPHMLYRELILSPRLCASGNWSNMLFHPHRRPTATPLTASSL